MNVPVASARGWALLASVALGSALLCGCAHKVVLREVDLPLQNLHLLNKGDTVVYVLPNGRRLSWETESDTLFSTEQTTACGLKAHLRRPAFEKLSNYGVVTAAGREVSIYSFNIDGYQVDRAEDLNANHCLPVIIRVSKIGGEREMDHEAARAFFNKHVAATAGQPLRVPISTILHGLLQRFPFPVRLVVMNDDITFDLSGDVFRVTEEERADTLSLVMAYVVERYEGIKRISRFSIQVMRDDEVAFRYEARKDPKGDWSLHKLAQQ